MSRKDEWLAECQLYENLFRMFVKRKTKVLEIPPKEGELGYTSADGIIHLARRHAILRTLKEEAKKQLFRMGVFAHEMCHQLFTDFEYMEKTLNNIGWDAERQVVMLFANLVEDPAIEYEAETVFGGDLLAALRFSIAHIYRTSPEIQESGDAFSQLCNALIQFGDEGMLKGHFTFDEAYDYFCQIAPEFNDTVINPDPKARIDAAVRWAKLTKPLWETDTVKEEKELMKRISQVMEDNSITKTNGTQPPQQPSGKPKGEADKEKRKNDMLKKISGKSQDEDQMEEQQSEDNGEGQSSGSQSDNSQEQNQEQNSGSDGSQNKDENKEDGKNQGNSSSSKGQKEEDQNGSSSGKSQKESSDNSGESNAEANETSEGEDSDSDNSGSNTDNSENSSSANGENSDSDSTPSSGSDKDSDTDNSKDSESKPDVGKEKEAEKEQDKSDESDKSDKSDKDGSDKDKTESSKIDDAIKDCQTDDGGQSIFEKEDKALDGEMLKSIRNTIERGAEGIEYRRKRDKIDYEAKSKHYGEVRCLNQVMTVKPGDRNAFMNIYGDILKKHSKDIRLLTSSLKRIFQQDTGENVRALSGRYNVVRASKQSTAKIFDRRRNPKNLDDLAVMLLIDESGSMSYNRKADIARNTAVILSESFAQLQIPCYIMGFTTGSQYDAVHHHYVSWKNTKEERLSLAGISASNANFDGFSIRNATEIIRKKPAEHKILFIISDGYPASPMYHSMSEGVADTTEAITEAKKITTVLGIGIGDCEPETLKHMYKGSFVHAKNVDELSLTLTKNLKKILKTY